MNDLQGQRESHMDRKDTETSQLEEFIKRKYEVVTEIVNCSLLSKNSETYLSYMIRIKSVGKDYILEKRYTDFENLHHQMRRTCGNAYTFRDFPQKSINIFNKFDQTMLNKRLEKLNQMLIYLSENYAEIKAVSFLEWIELYKNVLVNSPAILGSDKQTWSSANKSEPLLMDFLTQLNYSKDKDTIQIFKQMENFFLKNQPRLSSDFLKRFMRENSEMKSLFDIIFEMDEGGGHFICCYKLDFLLKLLDRTLFRNFEPVLRLFSTVTVEKLTNEYKIGSHLDCKGLRKCKTLAYELLRIYRTVTPYQGFHLTRLFNVNSEMKNYIQWENYKVITSIKSEQWQSSTVDQTAVHSLMADKQEEEALFSEETVHRNRSMTKFRLPEFFKKANETRKSWPLTMVNINRLVDHIQAVESDERKLAAIQLIQKRIGKTAVNSAHIGKFELDLGASALKINFDLAKRVHLKKIRTKDLARTALGLNADNYLTRGRKEFFLKYEQGDDSISLELRYQEVCNIKNKIIYTISSNYDAITEKMTYCSTVFPESVPIRFLGRMELDLTDDRFVKSFALFVQAADDESASVTCCKEALIYAIHQILGHFQAAQPLCSTEPEQFALNLPESRERSSLRDAFDGKESESTTFKPESILIEQSLLALNTRSSIKPAIAGSLDDF